MSHHDRASTSMPELPPTPIRRKMDFSPLAGTPSLSRDFSSVLSSAPPPYRLVPQAKLRRSMSNLSSLHTTGGSAPPIGANTSRRGHTTGPARQLDDVVIQNFYAVFHHFDTDDDDLLSFSQLRQIIPLFTGDDALGCDEKSDLVDTALRLACNVADDRPLPSSVTFPQFLNFFAALDANLDDGDDSRQSPDEIFHRLDPDSDGVITPLNLYSVLNYFGFQISFDQASAMTDFVASELDATHFTQRQFINALSDARESHVTFESLLSNPKESQTTLETTPTNLNSLSG